MAEPRLIIIGLDSVSPRIAFEVLEDVMPCLKSLRQSGRHGPLRSTDPPVTIPAWVTMTTGKDPGELGVYGFRNRRVGSYGMDLVSPSIVSHPRLWDLAASAGLSSVVVSVPLTYPPRAHPGGVMTSCFLTPGSKSAWVAPTEQQQDLEARFGPYLVDVPDFRTDDKERLLAGCRALTAQHFGIFRHLVESTSPHFAMIVDLAPDRLHHGLLGAILEEHNLFDPSSRFVQECRAYYRDLDREIERTLSLAGPDTVIMVVSDHGVRPLEGAVCVNEWLIKEGYLVLEESPKTPTPLSRLPVDWSRTRAWGEGGHHCRICFNVIGREPEGIVPADRLDAERRQLIRRIESLSGPDGKRLDNTVIIPEERYLEVKGLPPDLMVYWDDLRFRSVGTVGHGTVFTTSNDLGHDEANHARDGIFVIGGADVRAEEEATGFEIRDVFATSASVLGLDPPSGTTGKMLL
ncbi:MAG: phosphodiesterase [Deltaproteobacteria bacterium]|nr:phosphodiesterase [Deltaproteobacteria bacterium]